MDETSIKESTKAINFSTPQSPPDLCSNRIRFCRFANQDCNILESLRPLHQWHFQKLLRISLSQWWRRNRSKIV